MVVSLPILILIPLLRIIPNVKTFFCFLKWFQRWLISFTFKLISRFSSIQSFWKEAFGVMMLDFWLLIKNFAIASGYR